MVHAVVFGAQADQVVCVGRSTVLPVDDVMNLDATAGTARDPAAPIPQFDGASQGQRDDVPSPPDVEGTAATHTDDGAGGVAQDHPPQRLR